MGEGGPREYFQPRNLSAEIWTKQERFKIKDLEPFLDENGPISVGGRLPHSDFSFREQHPWVLPTNHRYSELLIQYCHERVMHSGVMDTLMQVRERYWVLKGRQLVKWMVSHSHISFWERLVRSAKTCLKRVSLNFEELTTMLAEVEAVLNSTPLSYVHSDVSEPQPLHPLISEFGKD